MIRTTGGRAFGATSTRSRPWLSAAASASSTGMMPSCAPSALMTRTGLIRICRFTRTLFSIAIVPPPEWRIKKTRADGSAPATSAPASQCGRRRSLLNPAVPRARTEGWGGWKALPLPDGQLVENYVPACTMSSQSTRFHRLPHELDELRSRHNLLLGPRAAAAHGHRPGLHLALAEDGHERDLLELGIADPIAQRLGAAVEAGAQAGPAQLLDERLPGGVEPVVDGQDAHPFGCEPHRERPAVVLDQPAHEPLHRAQQRAVDHDWPVRAVVRPDVLELEALRQVEVELERGALPLTAERVHQHDVDLRAVERTSALVHLVVQAAPLEHLAELLGRGVVDGRVADRLLRPGGEERVVLVPERGHHVRDQVEQPVVLFVDLVRRTEDVGVVLREAAHPHHA